MKLSLRTWVHRPVSSTPRCRLPTLSQPKPSTRRPTGIPRAAPRGRQASSHRPVPGKPGLRGQSRLLGNQRSGRYGRTRIGEEEGGFPPAFRRENQGKGNEGCITPAWGTDSGNKDGRKTRQPRQRRLRRDLRLYASGPQLHGARLPLRHWLGSEPSRIRLCALRRGCAATELGPAAPPRHPAPIGGGQQPGC